MPDTADGLILIADSDPAERLALVRALSPGGALDAAVEAREQGLARFIGITGHGWNVAAMHRRALERFDFDSVLMPWNWFCAQNAAY